VVVFAVGCGGLQSRFLFLRSGFSGLQSSWWLLQSTYRDLQSQFCHLQSQFQNLQSWSAICNRHFKLCNRGRASCLGSRKICNRKKIPTTTVWTFVSTLVIDEAGSKIPARFWITRRRAADFCVTARVTSCRKRKFHPRMMLSQAVGFGGSGHRIRKLGAVNHDGTVQSFPGYVVRR
jgi:hypothetical protein